MNHFKEIGTLLLEVAPSLATLFFGPYAGFGINLISKVIGMEKASVIKIYEFLKTHPESFIDKIKEIETNHSGIIQFLNSMKLPTKISISIEF